MKYILYLIFFILASCLSHDSKHCFLQTQYGYNIRGLDFPSQIDDLRFDKSKSSCGFRKINGINVWLSKALFINKDDNLEALWDVTLWDGKISVDFYEANESYVNHYIEETTKHYKENTKRFKDLKIEQSKPQKSRSGYCKSYSIEVKDYNLIERKAGRVCYQIGQNLFIDNLTFSQKTTEDKILSFEELSKKIASFEKQVIFIGKDSVFTGKELSLYWFNEIEK